MSSIGEDLPENWIRRESKSRPNQFYYFNTKTNVSQWKRPADATKNKKEKIPNSTTKRSKEKEFDESNRFKIGSKSKKVKKPSTPAQDRLQAQIAKNKALAESVKDAIIKETTTRLNQKQYAQSLNNNKREREPLSREKKSIKRQRVPDNKKEFEKGSSTSSIVSPIKQSGNIDEIPNIFPSNHPAQDRLNQLQKNLKSNIDPNVQSSNQTNQNSNDALQILKSGFGIDSIDSANATQQDDDMKMDWEPSFYDEATDSFMPLEDIVFKDLNESAYIVPDTNVFLDSLLCIRNIITKDEKYCVLVPFVVLQELDRLKSRPGNDIIASTASSAIKFIYNQLKSKNQRLQGQKATDDKQHIIDINNADDKILNCCLQLKSQSREVVLVTNDVNLSNKALTSGVEAVTSRECLKKYNL